MLNKNEIRHSTHKDFNRIINEELSISNNVNQAAIYLKDELLKNSKTVNSKTEFIDYYNKSNNPFKLPYTYKTGSFVTDIFDTKVIIDYTIYTSGIKYIENKLYGRTDYNRDDDSIVLTFNLAMSNGQTLPVYFEDTIYHELLHLYQYIKSKKDTMLSETERNIYNSIKMVLENEEYSNNEKTFANALYASFYFEQDAMVHGLYGFLMANKNRIDFWIEMVEQSDEYMFLLDLRYCIENIKSFPERLFQIHKETALSRFEQAYHRFQNKIGKMLTKAKSDMNKGELIEHRIFTGHKRSRL